MYENEIEVGETLFIQNSEGKDIPFEVLFSFVYEDTDAKYMVLLPIVEEQHDEITAVRYEQDDKNITMFVLSEEEWKMVAEVFQEFLAHLRLSEKDELQRSIG